MTLYLQINGTGNQLFSANVTWTKVVMDCVVNYTSSLTTTEKPIINGSTATPYPRINAIAKNSTTYTAHTNSVNAFINGTTLGYGGDVPLGTRETFEMDLNSASYPTLTTQIGFFTDKNNNYCIPANIYDIKIYNGTTLVAHYDMSTGTLTDQTGNGNNATLTGGTATFVNDGTSSGTTYIGSGTSQGTSSVTSNETLILSSSATSQETSSATSTEHLILSNSAISQGTSSATSNETLISNSGTTYSGSATSQSTSSAISTEKQIYSAHGQSQSTSQAISNDKLSLSVSAVSQGQSSAISTETIIGHSTTTYSGSATSQSTSSASSSERVIYEVKGVSQSSSSATSTENVRYFVTGISQGQSSAISKEQFISVQQIISHITLQGSRELHIVLQGQRDLHIVLKGGVDVPAENQNFTLEAGTDKIIDIPNIVDNISSLDLTSCTEIHYEAKRGANIISKSLTNGIVVTSPTDLSITLIPTDTHLFVGNFHHEVWCIDSNNKKTVLMTGSLTIVTSYADTTV